MCDFVDGLDKVVKMRQFLRSMNDASLSALSRLVVNSSSTGRRSDGRSSYDRNLEGTRSPEWSRPSMETDTSSPSVTCQVSVTSGFSPTKAINCCEMLGSREMTIHDARPRENHTHSLASGEAFCAKRARARKADSKRIWVRTQEPAKSWGDPWYVGSSG